MKCQKCGSQIPDGKIFCETCGSAIQMVPDYNPEEDFTIGSESHRAEEGTETPAVRPWWYRYRYGLMGLCLILAGTLGYQAAYHYTTDQEEAAAETEEPVFLERPQFGVLPGTYDYSPLLTITHKEKEQGEIYYTTDGTTPDRESRRYEGAISIDEGTTVVRAVFIRYDGVYSEEAVGTYQVVFDYPDEPVFSVPAGSYDHSFSVTLTTEEGCKIYYTTNGEEPGYESKLYRGPVYIPAGLTVLQAVAVDEDGGMSGIVEAIYDVSQSYSPPEQELPPDSEEDTEIP